AEPSATTGSSGTTSTATASNDTNWHPSKAAFTDIAKQADSMILGLRNVQADVQYTINMSSGRGNGKLVEKIRDPHTFSLQYPTVRNEKSYGLVPSLTYGVADGKKVMEKTGKALQTHPLGTSSATPTDLANSWPLVANREIFAGLLDGRKPFEGL